MARSASRRRSRREEEEEEPRGRASRGGRGGGRTGAAGPNPATLAMGAVVVGLVVVLLIVMNGDDRPAPKPTPLGPATTEKPKGTAAPVKEPPRPLTAEETREVDALFADAEKEMEEFRTLVREGWSLKNDEDDEQGANDKWVAAKKHYKAALGIVNEVMEDQDRYPEERQALHMRRWLDRLAGWTKEASNVPKVHD